MPFLLNKQKHVTNMMLENSDTDNYYNDSITQTFFYRFIQLCCLSKYVFVVQNTCMFDLNKCFSSRKFINHTIYIHVSKQARIKTSCKKNTSN